MNPITTDSVDTVQSGDEPASKRESTKTKTHMKKKMVLVPVNEVQEPSDASVTKKEISTDDDTQVDSRITKSKLARKKATRGQEVTSDLIDESSSQDSVQKKDIVGGQIEPSTIGTQRATKAKLMKKKFSNPVIGETVEGPISKKTVDNSDLDGTTDTVTPKLRKASTKKDVDAAEPVQVSTTD